MALEKLKQVKILHISYAYIFLLCHGVLYTKLHGGRI